MAMRTTTVTITSRKPTYHPAFELQPIKPAEYDPQVILSLYRNWKRES